MGNEVFTVFQLRNVMTGALVDEYVLHRSTNNAYHTIPDVSTSSIEGAINNKYPLQFVGAVHNQITLFQFTKQSHPEYFI